MDNHIENHDSQDNKISLTILGHVPMFFHCATTTAHKSKAGHDELASIDKCIHS